MNQFEIVAEPRSGSGSAEARRLRRTGRVPAVVYGGKDEPQSIHVSLKDLSKQLESEAFFSHILTLKVGGKSSQVVLKALQRHPVKFWVTHMDLQRVQQSQALTMHVPLHFLNEDTSPGHREGGIFSRHMTELEISCLPRDLPEYIEVDVGALAIGDVIHLEQVTLPAGVEIVTHGQEIMDSPVISVHHAQKMDVEPEEEEGVEGEESPEVGRVGEEEEESQDKED